MRIAYTIYAKRWPRRVLKVNATSLSNAKVPGYCDVEVEHEGETWKLDITQLYPTRDEAAKELFNQKLGNNPDKIPSLMLKKRFLKDSISTSRSELERRFLKGE